MNSDKLYKVQEQDLDRLKEILTVCFQNDPLYSTLIEDEATKERLLPHLLECDVTELFETCEVFADSPELRGVLILSDESDHRHAFYNYFVSLKESLITDGWLLHEDPTMKTFFNFVLGKDYLNSAWTAQLHETRRLHVIYLAVDPKFQHHGSAEIMMTAMGQGKTMVSPYHMALITETIANGGTLMQPYYVDKVTNYTGTEVKKNVPKSYKRIMTSEEAAQLKEYMAAGVSEGTGSVLSGRSYTVAGKTGTAEYSMTDGEKTHSWFTGFTNVDNPELVITVITEGSDGSAGGKAVSIAGAVLDSYYNR